MNVIGNATISGLTVTAGGLINATGCVVINGGTLTVTFITVLFLFAAASSPPLTNQSPLDGEVVPVIAASCVIGNFSEVIISTSDAEEECAEKSGQQQISDTEVYYQ